MTKFYFTLPTGHPLHHCAVVVEAVDLYDAFNQARALPPYTSKNGTKYSRSASIAEGKQLIGMASYIETMKTIEQ